jgi:hypothetical protein
MLEIALWYVFLNFEDLTDCLPAWVCFLVEAITPTCLGWVYCIEKRHIHFRIHVLVDCEMANGVF